MNVPQRTNALLDQLDSKRTFADVARLAGDIGVRLAGTPAERMAAAYLAEQLQAAGLEPQVEQFPIPIWTEHRASLRVDDEDWPVLSPCFGGTTGPIGVVGDIVAVGDPLTEAELGDIDLTGKIVLIDGRNVYFDYPDYIQTNLLIGRGVAGVIFAAGEYQLGGLLQAYYNFKRALHQPTPPSVIVSYDDARRLVARPVSASLVVEADVSWSKSISVLADLPGSDLPDEVVIVCAHNDSAPNSPGAFDNAAGCSIVAELARAFAAGPAPRRTIRFALRGGHEVGLFGSETWLRRHIDAVGQIAAVVNFDSQGVIEGGDQAALFGSASWLRVADTAFTDVGLPIPLRIGGSGVDSVNFAAVGRIAITISRWGTPRNHTPLDNLDPIGPSRLESGLRLGAALLTAVAHGTDLDAAASTPTDQLRQVQAYCARWGWGLTG